MQVEVAEVESRAAGSIKQGRTADLHLAANGRRGGGGSWQRTAEGDQATTNCARSGLLTEGGQVEVAVVVAPCLGGHAVKDGRTGRE